VREPLTHALEELLDDHAFRAFLQGIATVGSPNISGYADVAAQDQHIHIIAIVEI
jgi:hypothetical protein